MFGMVMRIVLFLFGAVLAGGGGYLGWLGRGQAAQLFPPDPAHPPWLLVGAIGGVVAGLVMLASALLPRSRERARLMAEAAHRRSQVQAADAYYAERARAADRDWRSGGLPPMAASAEPALEDRPAPIITRVAPPPPVQRQPDPPPAPVAAAAATPTREPAAVAIAAAPPPKTAPPPQPQPATFPATATLKPIPPAAELPPAIAPAPSPPVMATLTLPVAPPSTAPAAAHTPPPSAATPLDAIRAAIAANRLDEADRLLAEERNRLSNAGAGSELELAELTGLAGDHAAAAGKISGAKWLWRLSLQRFGQMNAIATPAARTVSERLRLADQ